MRLKQEIVNTIYFPTFSSTLLNTRKCLWFCVNKGLNLGFPNCYFCTIHIISRPNIGNQFGHLLKMKTKDDLYYTHWCCIK